MEEKPRALSIISESPLRTRNLRVFEIVATVFSMAGTALEAAPCPAMIYFFLVSSSLFCVIAYKRRMPFFLASQVFSLIVLLISVYRIHCGVWH